VVCVCLCFTQYKILLFLIRENANLFFGFHMSSESSLKVNMEVHAISYNITQSPTSRKVKIFSIQQMILELTCSYPFLNLLRN